MQKILNDDVKTLKLPKDIKNELNRLNINTVLELCNYSRMELTELGLTNHQTNNIAICLQLIGLDLKRNHAKKNTAIEAIKK